MPPKDPSKLCATPKAASKSSDATQENTADQSLHMPGEETSNSKSSPPGQPPSNTAGSVQKDPFQTPADSQTDIKNIHESQDNAHQDAELREEHEIIMPRIENKTSMKRSRSNARGESKSPKRQNPKIQPKPPKKLPSPTEKWTLVEHGDPSAGSSRDFLPTTDLAGSSGAGEVPKQPFGDIMIGKLNPPSPQKQSKGQGKSTKRKGGQSTADIPAATWNRKGQFHREGETTPRLRSTLNDPTFDTGIVTNTGITFGGFELIPDPPRGADEDIDIDMDDFEINKSSLVGGKSTNPHIDFSELGEQQEQDLPPLRRHKTESLFNDASMQGLSESSRQLLNMYQEGHRAAKHEASGRCLEARWLDFDKLIEDAISGSQKDKSEENVVGCIRELVAHLVQPKTIHTGDTLLANKRLHKFLSISLAALITSIPRRMLDGLECACLVLIAKIVATQGVIPLTSDLHRVLTQLGLKSEIIAKYEEPIKKVYKQWFNSIASTLRFPVLENNCAAVPWSEFCSYIDEITYNCHIGVIEITDTKILKWCKDIMSRLSGESLIREVIAIVLNMLLTQTRHSEYRDLVEHVQVQPWYSLDLAALRFKIEKKFAHDLAAATTVLIIKTVDSGSKFDLSQFPMNFASYLEVMMNDTDRAKKGKDKSQKGTHTSGGTASQKGYNGPSNLQFSKSSTPAGITREQKKRGFDELIKSELGKQHSGRIFCWYRERCNRKESCPFAHKLSRNAFEPKTQNPLSSFEKWISKNPGSTESKSSHTNTDGTTQA